MGFFSKVKNWFSRTFGNPTSRSSRNVKRATTTSNYGGGGSRSVSYYNNSTRQRLLDEEKRRKEQQQAEQKRKQQETTNALSKIIDAKSQGAKIQADSTRNAVKGADALLKRISEKTYENTERERKMREEARNSLKNLNKKAEGAVRTPEQMVKTGDYEYNRVRNYNTPSAGDRPTVRVSAQGFEKQMSNPTFRRALSGARGFSQGATNNVLDFLLPGYKDDPTDRAIEEYYQKNKSRRFETGGEILGTMAAFGLSGAPAAEFVGKGAKKIAPKLTAKASAKATEKIAANKLILRAAEKEAVKRFGVEGATKEAIAQIARRRAKSAVAELGKDIAVDSTVGLQGDINRAILDNYKDGQMDWKGFGRDMGLNAAINIPLSLATSIVPAARGLKNLDRSTNVLDNMVTKAAKNADDIRPSEAVNIRDLARPQNIDDAVRAADDAISPQAINEAVENAAVDTVERNADNVVRDSLADTSKVEPPKLTADERADNARNLRTPEAEAKAKPPTDVSEMRGVDEHMPSTNPEMTAENEARAELEAEARRMGEAEPKADAEPEGLNVHEAKGAASDKMPEGVGKARSAYYYANGEKIEGGMRTQWEEAWNASKEYSESHATGARRRKSKVGVTELNAMDSEAERELRQKLSDQGLLDYDVIHTEEMYDKIAKQMRDDPDRWIKEMIDINEGGALDFRATPEWQARVQYIMATVDPSVDTASEIAYTEAFKLAKDISSKGGQTLNLRRNFVHLTEMGKRDSALDDLVDMLLGSKGFVNKHPQLRSLGRFDQRNYVRAFLMDNPKIMNGVEKLVKAGSADEVSEAYTELLIDLNKENPKTAFDVIQEIRYLNMLGNPKTHIRNIFGSAFFAPIRQLSNALRGSLEERYIKKTGLDLTRHGGLSWDAIADTWRKEPKTEGGRKALEAFERLKTDVLGGMKYDQPTYKGRAKTLPGKGLDAAADFNSNLLTAEDNFFREKAFKENYIKSWEAYKKKGIPITPKIERQIEAEAIEEAKIATFNEYNEFANWLQKITRNANDPNASFGARWVGRGVNAIMPFTKVPANLAKQSFNYSPLGMAKGFIDIQEAVKRKDVALLNKAIDRFASGTTGTGIFMLGMLLGLTTDRFTTNVGKDDAAAKFKKQQGVQNYSVTLGEGDKRYSMTLDWLVPTSATFFAGVEMANQCKKSGFNPLTVLGDWGTVASRLAEPVIDSSMLSGLHSVLETMRGNYGNDDQLGAPGIFLRETAQSYMNSLIPTALGQASRTAYSSDKQLPQASDWTYFWNQTKSKTGLAGDNALTRKLGIEPLGADTDAYGNVKNEKKDAGDYVTSALKNFLSPANIQKVDLSELDEQKVKEYEDAVKNGADPTQMAYLFPKKQSKKEFTVGDQTVKMSNKDVSTYNQAKTTGGAEGARWVLEGIMFNRPTTDANGNKILSDDAYTPEQKEAIIKSFEGKSLREVEEWLYQQPQFQSASEAEKRRVINGLWSLTSQGKSVAAKRVGEQAVVQAQGGDVDQYNFNNEISDKRRAALQPYIDAGVLTYAECVDYARNAGKTYYYENDEGGTSSTYYNKAQQIEYLIKMGYSYEKAEALYNAFKAANAKPYSGNNLSSGRGRRRGGYRRYYRRRGHGGSKKKAKVPTPKKMGKLEAGKALTSSTSSKGKSKVTPPTLKRVEAKIDLPTVRK